MEKRFTRRTYINKDVNKMYIILDFLIDQSINNKDAVTKSINQ